ncbi:MAG: hypothetical protein AAFY88_07670, partial [Acidobacteriota bacterium]
AIGGRRRESGKGEAAGPDGPTLIEFVVQAHDVVFPMVPAGADLDAMIRRPKSPESSVSLESPGTGAAGVTAPAAT